MQAVEIKNLKKSFIEKIPRGLRCFNLIYFLINRQSNQLKLQAPILRNVNLSIPVGKKVGISGRNGSGKSTLLRIIAGIYSYDSGEVKITGSTLYISGYSVLINKELSVLDNFFFVSSAYGVPENEIAKNYFSILNEVGLNEYLERKTFSLSDGQRSRLGFGISLLIIQYKNPAILILDEVFAGEGDAEFKKYSVEKIREIIEGKTVLLVSHDLNLLKRECDLYYNLKDGQLSSASE